MNDEKFYNLVTNIELLVKNRILSYESGFEAITSGFHENKKFNQFCDYRSLKNAISFKKKCDTSYWATTHPETSPNAPESISFTVSMDIPKIDTTPLKLKPEPFWIEAHGIFVDGNGARFIERNPINFYFNSAELLPINRKQYAAKVRWARLRKLNNGKFVHNNKK
jgi:hypothetical protein